MATKQLIKHGTRAGYDAELAAGGPENVCDRCRAAKRVYAKQFTKQGRAQGLHYTAREVIDHLDTMGQPSPTSRQQPSQGKGRTYASQPPEASAGTNGTSEADSDQTGSQSLRDRLSDALFTLKTETKTDAGYVPIDEMPEYITPANPDPEPSGEDWSQVRPDEYVVTAADFNQIKDNLGTYLATIGMTLGIIDGYCGTILRDNLDDMVNSWAKVITHYPSAVRIFTAKGGGKIMAWIEALIATWPILLAIYEHHLAQTIKIDSLGRAIKVSKADANLNGNFATQPDFNYTVD